MSHYPKACWQKKTSIAAEREDPDLVLIFWNTHVTPKMFADERFCCRSVGSTPGAVSLAEARSRIKGRWKTYKGKGSIGDAPEEVSFFSNFKSYLPSIYHTTFRL